MMYAYSVTTKRLVIVAVVALAMVMSGQRAQAQPGWVMSHQKISETQGGGPTLDNWDLFGYSVASLGDLDGDGPSVLALAVGVYWDDDGGVPLGANRGAVWVLFLNSKGMVESSQKISDTQGGFLGKLDDGDRFGTSVVSLGDLDGDGVVDLAVGAHFDDDGSAGPCDDPLVCNRGAVWILFLNTDGTVKSDQTQKISDTEGNFTGILADGDHFGRSVAYLGDLDGDKVGDLAVGALYDADGGSPRGAVWVLFLNSNGTVKTHQKISDTEGGFTGILEDDDRFGHSVAFLGDLDGDGVGDIVVGAIGDDDGGLPLGANRGAVWILFLNSDGTVKCMCDDGYQKISETQGGFTGILDDVDRFGSSVALLDDLNGDGVDDLVVGARSDDDGCTEPPDCERGAVWIMFLNTDGTVKSHQKISDTEGGFTGTLDDLDYFGWSAAGMGDLNGDGIGDLAVGAHQDDDGDGGLNRGAVWVLFLDGVGACPWDLDGTGGVGILDLLALLAAWGTDPGGPPDFDNDGNVGILDLLTLLANWGPCG